MNPDDLEQLKITLIQAANAADISTAEALAELVRAFLLSETDAPEFVKILDKLLVIDEAVSTEAAP
tara:strand:+ start:10916 stop:11113 length:198 start_codon:yes stop_codon:yes gene_type:complete